MVPKSFQLYQVAMIDVVLLLVLLFPIIIWLVEEEYYQLDVLYQEYEEADRNTVRNWLRVDVACNRVVVKGQVMDHDELKAWLYPIARSKIEPRTK